MVAIASQLYLYPHLARLDPSLGPSSVISPRPTSIPPTQVLCTNGKSFAYITNASSRRITRASELTTSELACARQVSPDHLVNFNGCCHNYICRPLVGTCTRHTSIARFALLALGFIFLGFVQAPKPCFRSIKPMPPGLDSHPSTLRPLGLPFLPQVQTFGQSSTPRIQLILACIRPSNTEPIRPDEVPCSIYGLEAILRHL